MSAARRVQLQRERARHRFRYTSSHQLLIEPLADALALEASVVIVPDRDLYALPFAALLDASGKHLIEHHSLRVAPSVGTVIQLEEGLQARAAPAEP